MTPPSVSSEASLARGELTSINGSSAEIHDSVPVTGQHPGLDAWSFRVTTAPRSLPPACLNTACLNPACKKSACRNANH